MTAEHVLWGGPGARLSDRSGILASRWSAGWPEATNLVLSLTSPHIGDGFGSFLEVARIHVCQQRVDGHE